MAESLTERLNREAHEVMEQAWGALVVEGDCTCHRCLGWAALDALDKAGFLLCRDTSGVAVNDGSGGDGGT